MPIIESTYKPPFYFRNGFVATVYSGLIRRISLKQERERITLSDGDFLDLDWSYSQSKTNKVIILLHGLEGNGQRPYITGAAKLFNSNDFDAICVNFRGCSGEENLNYYSYHSGSTSDLEAVVNHAITKGYREIVIKGISLGANIMLKYLGEHNEVPNEIKAGIAVSAPCDLSSASKEIHKLKNKLFHDRFIKDLKNRLMLKQQNFPNELSTDAINSIRTLRDFDDVYTAKAHGFKDVDDYHKQCSSLKFLRTIKVPTLIINALNDSFLSPECFPVKEVKQNPNLFLEMPKWGGHVGFIARKNIYYNEKKALEFYREQS